MTPITRRRLATLLLSLVAIAAIACYQPMPEPTFQTNPTVVPNETVAPNPTVEPFPSSVPRI